MIPVAGHEHLAQVLDRDGARWFLKCAVDDLAWRREVRAYRRWAPVLADRAPQLRAAFRRHRLLLVDAVPGVPAGRSRVPREPISEQAGELIRTLHGARPARTPGRRIDEVAMARLEAKLARNDGVLDRVHDEGARARVERLAELDRTETVRNVPCHGDLADRNLLVDDAGVVRLIDFGAARWEVGVFDFVRPAYGLWRERPDLAHHFFTGYGRRLTDVEHVVLDAYLALHAVTQALRGSARGVEWVVRQARERLLADPAVPFGH